MSRVSSVTDGSADPRFSGAHNNLGLLLASKGDSTGAESCYRNAVAADPNRFQAVSSGSYVKGIDY